jgi:hypothetical protein
MEWVDQLATILPPTVRLDIFVIVAAAKAAGCGAMTLEDAHALASPRDLAWSSRRISSERAVEVLRQRTELGWLPASAIVIAIAAAAGAEDA